MGSWILPLYSIVTYAAGLKTIDFIVEGIDRSKAAMIITSKPEEISKSLMEIFECGTTKISVKGGYSNSDMTMIYFILDRFQIIRIWNKRFCYKPMNQFTFTLSDLNIQIISPVSLVPDGLEVPVLAVILANCFIG